jgi:hypothetical protein
MSRTAKNLVSVAKEAKGSSHSLMQWVATHQIGVGSEESSYIGEEYQDSQDEHYQWHEEEVDNNENGDEQA